VLKALVIFDVDGTLIRSVAVDSECYASAFCDHLGIDGTSTAWETYPRGTDPGIAVTLYERHRGRAPLPSELAAFHDLFAERLRAALGIHQLDEVPGARALLSALRADARFELAIATGAWRRSAMLKLTAADIDVAGIPFASADDAFDRSQIVRTAMARSKGDVDRAIFVSDGLFDVATASKLGIGFLGVGNGERAAALKDAGAGSVLADFLDTAPIVEKLWAAAIPFTP
jgi:phosphoglycolate phosphatase-like HAD superfamily hydrolase